MERVSGPENGGEPPQWIKQSVDEFGREYEKLGVLRKEEFEKAAEAFLKKGRELESIHEMPPDLRKFVQKRFEVVAALLVKIQATPGLETRISGLFKELHVKNISGPHLSTTDREEIIHRLTYAIHELRHSLTSDGEMNQVQYQSLLAILKEGGEDCQKLLKHLPKRGE